MWESLLQVKKKTRLRQCESALMTYLISRSGDSEDEVGREVTAWDFLFFVKTVFPQKFFFFYHSEKSKWITQLPLRFRSFFTDRSDSTLLRSFFYVREELLWKWRKINKLKLFFTWHCSPLHYWHRCKSSGIRI